MLYLATVNRVLDASLAVSLIGRENPNELIADRQEISSIRLIDTKDNDRNKEKVAAIRKLNISFNPLQQPHALDGLDQVLATVIIYESFCLISCSFSKFSFRN